ncbi:HTH_48 domain-containing protein [Nephila pilipes]|uniref:HTH_48 domain-containing protein n=1 Tax=Nephila pilipes TaxID=299642 RepID=A0A8X6URK2_NEPPI|nr:HTH_48 domain-containing protein [Nephila pilipes]
MELSLASRARYKLRSVTRFLCAKNTAPVDIHSQLCGVNREKCMSLQDMRKWCREFKEGCTDIHDEQRSGLPLVSDERLRKWRKHC